ncbi:Uncharacterised protein [Vibrio cholerae]|nr:Uncharacterised protein [Vibrio cholerae]
MALSLVTFAFVTTKMPLRYWPIYHSRSNRGNLSALLDHQVQAKAHSLACCNACTFRNMAKCWWMEWILRLRIPCLCAAI